MEFLPSLTAKKGKSNLSTQVCDDIEVISLTEEYKIMKKFNIFVRIKIFNTICL